jgi:hypothetical protein
MECRGGKESEAMPSEATPGLCATAQVPINPLVIKVAVPVLMEAARDADSLYTNSYIHVL